MPPSTISPHILQSRNIFTNFPSQISLDGHIHKFGSDGSDGFGVYRADSCPLEDGKLGEDPGGVLVPNPIESLEGFLRAELAVGFALYLEIVLMG